MLWYILGDILNFDCGGKLYDLQYYPLDTTNYIFIFGDNHGDILNLGDILNFDCGGKLYDLQYYPLDTTNYIFIFGDNHGDILNF